MEPKFEPQSPHSKLLKYSSLTDPLLVQLLEQADQVQIASADHSGHDLENRFRRKKWASQFTSLTDMAGWMSASPWYKWKLKGRFPVKLFLHFSITILSIIQIVFLTTNTGKVIRNTKTLVNEMMLPVTSPVYNLTGLLHATNHTMCGLCAFQDDSIVVFDFNQPFELTVETLVDGGQIFNSSKPDFSMDTVSNTYSVYCSDCPNSLSGTSLDTTGMSKKERQTLRHALAKVIVRFGIQQFSYSEGGRYCLNWDIELKYELSLRRGNICMPVIKSKPRHCGHWPRDPVNIPLVWLNIWLLIFSFWSFILVMRQFGRHYHLYSTVRREVRGIEMGSAPTGFVSEQEKRKFLRTWNKLSSIRKTKFFSAWHLWTLSTNVLQIVGSSSLLYKHGQSGDTLINYLIGLAASGALLNMVRYFKFFPKSYLLILTLRYALPTSLRFLLCATIMYVAYAVLGMALFGEGAAAFSDLGQSIQTLFAIVNGDHITEYLTALNKASNQFISRAYVFSFIVLCMWVVLNILLAVVVEGYNQAVQRVKELPKEAAANAEMNGVDESTYDSV